MIMAEKKNLVLRKKINEVLYDLMVKTMTDQVYNSNDSKTLTQLLAEINTAIDAKADTTDLTELETKFNNLIQDAPEAYDTLKEISEYISTHQDEYQALLVLAGNKVDKEDGKGLSTNDFTNELKTKLDELYDKATLDEKLESMTQRISALEHATGGDPTEITAADVKYTIPGGEDTTVKAVLDDLLYVDLVVSTVTSPTSTSQEIGDPLTDLVINWTYNKDVVSQSFNGSNLPDVSQRSYTVEGPVTTNTTYTIKGNDGKMDATKSITFTFRNKVYWGVSAETVSGNVNSSFILGLTGSKFATATSGVGTISANAEAGNYIFYAQPASFAEPTFNIGGFDTTFPLFATIDFTNASGHQESYNVYRSNQAGLGSTSMTVK